MIPLLPPVIVVCRQEFENSSVLYCRPGCSKLHLLQPGRRYSTAHDSPVHMPYSAGRETAVTVRQLYRQVEGWPQPVRRDLQDATKKNYKIQLELS